MKEPLEWIRAHRSEIVEHWKHRVRPLAHHGAADAPWEERIDTVFDQVCVLIADDDREYPETDVEAKLFTCARVKEHEGHRFSAELLASGRRAIGDVSKVSGEAVARRCAEECGSAIDYLQHSLQMNLCQDCKAINCCMRVESFEALPGGTNE